MTFRATDSDSRSQALAVPVSNGFLAYVLEQLRLLEPVTPRRMFGGVGLYADGLFFALIHNDTLYFKVDDSNRAAYQQRGSTPFAPYANRPRVSMNYFDVPVEVLDDPEDLHRWAKQSVAVARGAAAKSNGGRCRMTSPQRSS